MNKNVKKIVGVVLSLTLAVMCNGTEAYAASSASAGVDGTTAYASITTGSSSATAKTTYARTADSITAKATVYYMINSTGYSKTASNSSTAGGTSATASTSSSITGVVGGKGEHTVKVGNLTWTPTTTTGTTW
ncbi:MAG: hypothetical protein ACI4AD_08595 [Roseburia sp.]